MNRFNTINDNYSSVGDGPPCIHQQETPSIYNVTFMVDGEAEDTYLKLDQWTKVLFIIISTLITCCQRYEMSRF